MRPDDLLEALSSIVLYRPDVSTSAKIREGHQSDRSESPGALRLYPPGTGGIFLRGRVNPSAYKEELSNNRHRGIHGNEGGARFGQSIHENRKRKTSSTDRQSCQRTRTDQRSG